MLVTKAIQFVVIFVGDRNIMNVEEILELIKTTRGTNAKKQIILDNQDNKLFIKTLKYALDPFMPFNIVKVPKTANRLALVAQNTSGWVRFFSAADKCAQREVTGNRAIDLMSLIFSTVTEAQEMWMRKILKKHLAIGVSQKTVNAVIPRLVPTFEVSLAQKFDFKRIKSQTVAIEPKLDGIRCLAVVEDQECFLYSRAGKLITNFDETIGKELVDLGDGCYDGEIMGEDFTALMRQAYRKGEVDTTGTFFALFDFLPLNEWKSKKSTMSTHQRYDELLTKLSGSAPTSMGMSLPRSSKKYLRPVERKYVASDQKTIKAIHDNYVKSGYEGAMIKNIDAAYTFGRSFDVMKYKDFHDVDLPVKQLLEGTGKHSGKLGSFVVEYKGVDVQVGSGLSDELRATIWQDPDLFVGRMIEVRYQEVTPDGSLRFPTFVCFRNDR